MQLKWQKPHCNFAKANAKIGQRAKFAMLLAQVASRTQTLSLNSIIENSGSNTIVNANAKANANAQCE